MKKQILLISHKLITALIGMGLFVAAGCSARADSRLVSQQTSPTSNGPELQLTPPPAAMTEPSERAAFVIEHYWDKMNWTDTTLTLNDAFMEQNLANYFDLFNYTDTLSVKKGISVMLNRASADSIAFSRVLEITDSYLYDPNSPMLNESHYGLFVNTLLETGILDKYSRLVYETTAADLIKNRIGSKAADFQYVDRQGKKHNFNDIIKKGRGIFLLFYDPDCENCEIVEKRVAANSIVNRMLAGGTLEVVAVCPYEIDLDHWKEHASTLPENWIVGYSPDGIIDTEGIYVLRASPTIYMIDSDGIVVGKDVTVDDFFSSLK